MVEDSLAAAAADLAGRHPEADGELDDRARARLVQVVADPAGTSWMDAAGLLDSDSCGYPVAGGYYDVKSDLGALPAAQDPAVRDRVLQGLNRQWADDYILTGRARRDRSWAEQVERATPD